MVLNFVVSFPGYESLIVALGDVQTLYLIVTGREAVFLRVIGAVRITRTLRGLLAALRQTRAVRSMLGADSIATSCISRASAVSV